MLNRRLPNRAILASVVSVLLLTGCDRSTPTSVVAGELVSTTATREFASGSALVSVDDPVFGPGAVTRDQATGLEWLDLTFSTNRSFEEITGVNGPSQLVEGGDFAGWRYATVAEVTSLFVDAGIPDVPGFSPANRGPVLALMALVGVTCVSECSDRPASIGISATPDPANPPLLFLPNIQDWAPSFASVNFTLLLDPATRGPSWGSWLVRSAPAVDVTAPETQILSADAEGVDMVNGGVTLSGAMTVAFSGSDNVGVVGFECRLDAASYSPCSSPAAYAALAVGAHAFEVRALDAAGNTDPSPASITWTVITPSVATQNLIDAIQGMSLGRGVASSLTAPLREVSRLLEDGNPNNDKAACNKLGAFANEVGVKARNGQLTAEQAAPLSAAVAAIRRTLGC